MVKRPRIEAIDGELTAYSCNRTPDQMTWSWLRLNQPKPVWRGGPIGHFTADEILAIRKELDDARSRRCGWAATRYILLQLGEAIEMLLPAERYVFMRGALGIAGCAEQEWRNMLALARYIEEKEE